MAESPWTYSDTLKILFEKGVRYSTVIDVGSADGHFHLSTFSQGLVPGSIGVNIDANPIYENSLRAIREVMGGYYLIAAVTDHVGEVELTTSVHPYWGSVRAKGDRYWEKINALYEGELKVPSVTLDSVVEKFGLKPPFLLKLDIQGSEAAALRGATKTLTDTNVIICETDLDDFNEINGLVAQCGFGLFDVTTTARLADRSLGWFYPIYLNRKLDGIRSRQFWATDNNSAIIEAQVSRRKGIQEFISNRLGRFLAPRDR